MHFIGPNFHSPCLKKWISVHVLYIGYHVSESNGADFYYQIRYKDTSYYDSCDHREE